VKKSLFTQNKLPLPLDRRNNECWSMDFMQDELYNGQRIRLLTLVDNFTRESLAIEVDQYLGNR